MDIVKLCDKSKLNVVQIAYMDLLDWNTPLTPKRIIEEIEWKLFCIDMDGLDYWGCTKRDVTYARKFVKKLYQISGIPEGSCRP